MPRIPDPRFAPDCTISFDGRPAPARTGESVAAALLAAGRPILSRSYKYHRPRGAFCLAGSCAQCLVRVDGVPSQRACRIPCRDGLAVESQNAFPDAAHDLLTVIDRLYPHGLDHHHLMTFSRVANRAALAVSRQLAGLGRLPDAEGSAFPPTREERFDALVVGSGPAGLGAAEALASAGRRVLLVEEERALGGRLRCRLDLPDAPSLAWADEVARAVERSGGEAAIASSVLALWRDGGAPVAGVLSLVPPARLRLVRADRIVLCPGGTATPPGFEDNDLPGILGARGLAIVLAEDGVLPGARCAVAGMGSEAEALAARFAASGIEARTIATPIARARGRGRVEVIELEDGTRLECDAVAAAGPPSPATELAREAGAAVELDPARGAFRVRAASDGATAVSGLWVAGEATGAMTPGEAAAMGRRAGEAARG